MKLKKRITLPILFSVALLSCKTDNPDPANAENSSLLVQPIQTDGNYAAADKKHYVVRNTQKHLNKLLLFIGGSSSNPADYNLISDHGATIGLDVINLSYPNEGHKPSLLTKTVLLNLFR